MSDVSIKTKESMLSKPIPVNASTLLVGFPVTFIGLSIISGGVNQAISTLLFSIICTAGVGLIFWIVVSLLVGLVVLGLVKLFSTAFRYTVEEDKRRSMLPKEDIPLYEYILRSTNSHQPKEKTISILKSSGWSDDAINQAYSIAKES